MLFLAGMICDRGKAVERHFWQIVTGGSQIRLEGCPLGSRDAH